MRKLMSLVLSIVLVLSLAACGNNSNNSEPEMEFSNLEWPTDEIAKQIPIPKSTMAYIMNSGSAIFEFYLANTTLEDFNAYVEECKAKGFTLNAVEQDNRYYAFDEEEYELTVQHKDGDIMYICVEEERFSVEIKLLHKDSTSADMYNLWIEIDGFWEDDSEKGSEAITFESYLKEGKHTLMIENDDDDNINGRIDFVVSEDNEYFEFEINCLSNKIEITPITDSSSNTSVTNDEASSEIDETTYKNEADNQVEETDEKSTSSKDEDSASINEFSVYDAAILVCQKIKDALYNPDSFQLNQVYYVDAYWHSYYIDYSAMNQMGGYTRHRYQADFNKDSSLYRFDEVYDLPEIFEEIECEALDTDIIESKLK